MFRSLSEHWEEKYLKKYTHIKQVTTKIEKKLSTKINTEGINFSTLKNSQNWNEILLSNKESAVYKK